MNVPPPLVRTESHLSQPTNHTFLLRPQSLLLLAIECEEQPNTKLAVSWGLPLLQITCIVVAPPTIH